MSVHRNQSRRARDNRNGVADLGIHGNYSDGDEGQRIGRGEGRGGGAGGGFSSSASQFQQQQQQQRHQPYHSNTAGAGVGSYSHSTSHSPHSNLVHSSSASESRQQNYQHRAPQQHQQCQEEQGTSRLSYVNYADLIPPPSPTYFEMVGTNRLSITGTMAIGGDITGTPLRRAGDGPSLQWDLSKPKPSNEEPTADMNAMEENISWHQKLSIWMINDGKASIAGASTHIQTGTWKGRKKERAPPACLPAGLVCPDKERRVRARNDRKPII